MYALRSFALAWTMLAFVITTAHAADPPITFIQPVKSAPKGADVLFGIPLDLDLQKKITVVVYFHGLRGNESFADVLKRQRVAQQVADANVNAVLIAPSMSYPIRKKDAKPFAAKGAFRKFLKETETVMARILNTSPTAFAGARIVIVGYSAGHLPTKMVLEKSDVTLGGVVLLDAHYGSQNIFANYAISVAKGHSGFFVSAYTDGTAERAKQFEKSVLEAKVPIVREFPLGHFDAGTIILIKIRGDHLHRDLVTTGWIEDPITQILKAYGREPN